MKENQVASLLPSAAWMSKEASLKSGSMCSTNTIVGKMVASASDSSFPCIRSAGEREREREEGREGRREGGREGERERGRDEGMERER